jgi:hypothetical protein
MKSTNELKFLQKRDVFYMEYGGTMLKFIVARRLGDVGVLAHSHDWLKSSSILISFADENTIFYVGKRSRLRYFLSL